jgi:hypothetical protein
VRENNHLWGFPTNLGYGSEPIEQNNNPMLQPTDVVIGGRKCLVNDVFRIVHDYFGHIKEGNGFRAAGEENAWRSHSAMYSELARPAMTSETRAGVMGQSRAAGRVQPHGHAPTLCAAKIGLMPDWVMNEGRKDPGAANDAEFKEEEHKRDVADSSP